MMVSLLLLIRKKFESRILFRVKVSVVVLIGNVDDELVSEIADRQSSDLRDLDLSSLWLKIISKEGCER